MAIPYKTYSSNYNATDRKEYYKRIIFPERISLFADLWKPGKATQTPEDTLISFRGISFGCSPDSVVTLLGQPRFIVENHGLSSLVYFYKENINNHRVLTQIHFWGKEFFYACYIFRDESSSSRRLIKGTLFEKYSVDQPESDKLFETLSDRNNNLVSVHDSVNFNILYLWGDDKIKRAVSEKSYSVRFGNESEQQRKKMELWNKL